MAMEIDVGHEKREGYLGKIKLLMITQGGRPPRRLLSLQLTVIT
jgi:hypothetical protein